LKTGIRSVQVRDVPHPPQEAILEFDAKFDEKILSLIAEAAPGKSKKGGLTKDMRLQSDLGIDSIALVAMVFRMEETFGIDLSDLDLGSGMGRIRTVGDALTVSREIVKQARAATDLRGEQP
jgi:acyl carrier protein